MRKVSVRAKVSRQTASCLKWWVERGKVDVKVLRTSEATVVVGTGCWGRDVGWLTSLDILYDDRR